MMYRCKNCGEIFDTPDTQYTVQWHTEIDDGGNMNEYIPVSVCPYCGTDYIEEIEETEDEENGCE